MTREKSKQVRLMLNQAMELVLPHVVRDLDSVKLGSIGSMITRFTYVELGLDQGYMDFSPSSHFSTFRDTLDGRTLQKVAEYEVKLTKKILELPSKMKTPIKNKYDLLHLIKP